ncbi:MAG: flagellar basal body L-ring protein FlgH [Gammaproteobacteria bacterium]|jgi:flagellar L-ring protein precursor FlgH|nr:flagellar basal body L-ring protein FlgH [Gammaproteobacteria bacterium]
MIKNIIWMCAALISLILTGCMNHITGPDDPNFAPVMPDIQSVQTPDMGSIYYQKEGLSLYDDIKARHVGDVITVLLSEVTNATKTANSQYEKKSQETLPEPSLFGTVAKWDAPKQLPIPLQTTDNLGFGVNINGDTKLTGTASGTQKNQLIGKISVVVTKIYPNGNMYVRGEKWININDGDEFVRVSGIIRQEDVNSDNTIDSNRIADARISYSGTGAFANASKPGWLMKFLTSPWWPI